MRRGLRSSRKKNAFLHYNLKAQCVKICGALLAEMVYGTVCTRGVDTDKMQQLCDAMDQNL